MTTENEKKMRMKRKMVLRESPGLICAPARNNSRRSCQAYATIISLILDRERQSGSNHPGRLPETAGNFRMGPLLDLIEPYEIPRRTKPISFYVYPVGLSIPMGSPGNGKFKQSPKSIHRHGSCRHRTQQCMSSLTLETSQVQGADGIVG